VEKLDKAISVIESLNGPGTTRQANQPTQPWRHRPESYPQLHGGKWPWRNRLDGRRFGRNRNQQWGSENDKLGSCEAHHVASGPEEDRSVSESEMQKIKAQQKKAA